MVILAPPGVERDKRWIAKGLAVFYLQRDANRQRIYLRRMGIPIVRCQHGRPL